MNKKKFFRSKEQILFDKQQQKLKETQGKFIDEKLMPFLEENTVNLEEAQFLTESLQVAVNQAWDMKKRETKLSDLKMKESLAKVKNPKAVVKHVRLIEILEDQTIDDAIRLLSAVYEEANRVIMYSFKDKNLKDFKNANDKLPTS